MRPLHYRTRCAASTSVRDTEAIFFLKRFGQSMPRETLN